MQLAGVPVRKDLVEVLADLVDEPTASLLRVAVERGTLIVALTVEDRERILRALEECPEGLGELRGVLTAEHEWRVRKGLV